MAWFFLGNRAQQDWTENKNILQAVEIGLLYNF